MSLTKVHQVQFIALTCLDDKILLIFMKKKKNVLCSACVTGRKFGSHLNKKKICETVANSYCLVPFNMFQHSLAISFLFRIENVLDFIFMCLASAPNRFLMKLLWVDTREHFDVWILIIVNLNINKDFSQFHWWLSWFTDFSVKLLFFIYAAHFFCVNLLVFFVSEDKTNDSMVDLALFFYFILHTQLNIWNPCVVPSVFAKWMNFVELAKIFFLNILFCFREYLWCLLNLSMFTLFIQMSREKYYYCMLRWCYSVTEL